MMETINLRLPTEPINVIHYDLPTNGVATGFVGWDNAYLEILTVIRAYARAAVQLGKFDQIEPDQWFGTVDGLDGVWGEGPDIRQAADDLEQAIIGWVEVKIRRGADVPAVNGIRLSLS